MLGSNTVSELIGIVDYGVGNLHSITNAITHLGLKCEIISKGQAFSKYSKVILPGVGAFPYAMHQISINGYDSEIYDFVKSGKHLLGICLGMQILASKSYEIEQTNGLGLLHAEVHSLRSIISSDLNPTIPNMGWRNIDLVNSSCLIRNSASKQSFLYFAHSYAVKAELEISSYITTTFSYFGTNFISSIEKDNVNGLQFHPEKSGKLGIEILRNFVNIK